MNRKTIKLQVGMRVKIMNIKRAHYEYAGTIKTITKVLPIFGKSRAFALDGDDGIWLISDFQMCVNYPDLIMI